MENQDFRNDGFAASAQRAYSRIREEKVGRYVMAGYKAGIKKADDAFVEFTEAVRMDAKSVTDRLIERMKESNTK